MNKLISRPLLGVLALLCSSPGFAATVVVTASVPNVINSTVPTAFYVDVSVTGFPLTGGTELGLTYDPTRVTYVSTVKVPGATTPTVQATPFDTVSWVLWSPANYDITAFSTDAAATGPNFDAFRVNFTAVVNANGPAYIAFQDLGNYYKGWFDAVGDPINGGAIPTYTYDGGAYTPYWVIVGTPVPPAAWLFGSALAALGWVRRKTRSQR